MKDFTRVCHKYCDSDDTQPGCPCYDDTSLACRCYSGEFNACFKCPADSYNDDVNPIEINKMDTDLCNGVFNPGTYTAGDYTDTGACVVFDS